MAFTGKGVLSALEVWVGGSFLLYLKGAHPCRPERWPPRYIQWFPAFVPVHGLFFLTAFKICLSISAVRESNYDGVYVCVCVLL